MFTIASGPGLYQLYIYVPIIDALHIRFPDLGLRCFKDTKRAFTIETASRQMCLESTAKTRPG